MLRLLFILISAVIVSRCNEHNNNVCKTYKDYNTKLFNKNCWYNPDAELGVPEVIRLHGYPLEKYKVKTKDGYILQLFRIPRGLKTESVKSRQPVYIQHGVFSSPGPFVTSGNKSIAFRLADEGYDVWLGNSRGSTHGKGHVKMSLRDARYWDFSFHEMAIYDVPSSLDLIARRTKRKDIIFLANSMGSCLPLVYETQMPKHASQRLKLIFHLAPTVFVGNAKTQLKILAYYEEPIAIISALIKMYELLPMRPLNKMITKALCEGSSYQALVCTNLIHFAFGASDLFQPENLPVLTGHFPAGTSVKTLLHLLQGYRSKKFRKYDYGKQLNMARYNSTTPPSYDLKKVKTPNYIMYGTQDSVSTEEDTTELFSTLPNAIGLWKIEGYNHVDFFYAKNVVPSLQNEMFRVLDSYKNNY